MNLAADSVPERSPRDIRDLVESGIREFADPFVADAFRRFLVPPRREMWNWDYFQQESFFPVWVLAIGVHYNEFYIVYSDYGFAPEFPWGLGKVPQKNFGPDYCWYPRLEGAFRESFLFKELEGK